MIDISAVGAFVTLKMKGNGKYKGTTITEFSDEGTPFECPDVDLSDNRKNLNGQMISSRQPSVYTVSVTVIPGSRNDQDLSELAQQAALQPGSITPISDLIIDTLELNVPEIDESSAYSGVAGRNKVRKYKWMNGRFKSAPTGPSTSAEGRMSARTYTFEFEKYIAPSGGFSNVDSYLGT